VEVEDFEVEIALLVVDVVAAPVPAEAVNVEGFVAENYSDDDDNSMMELETMMVAKAVILRWPKER